MSESCQTSGAVELSTDFIYMFAAAGGCDVSGSSRSQSGRGEVKGIHQHKRCSKAYLASSLLRLSAPSLPKIGQL